MGLLDKELRLWVTYPEKKKKKTKRRGKTSKSGGSKLKLWAVVIIESLDKKDAFTYDVTLKRIGKKD